jgi:hypothetical protein
MATLAVAMRSNDTVESLCCGTCSRQREHATRSSYFAAPLAERSTGIGGVEHAAFAAGMPKVPAGFVGTHRYHGSQFFGQPGSGLRQ